MKLRYGSWRYAVPATVGLAFIGMMSGSVEFFVAAIVPALFLLFSAISRDPDTDDLELEREISDEAPSPGQHVEVTLRATNNGSTTMTDFRLVDGVPEGLKVAGGSPRASLAVTPGSTSEFSYRVVARRGSYVFDDVKAEFRGGGPSAEGFEKEASGDLKIQCRTELQEVVLRDETESQTGDLVTSEGGSGIEFHSLRDYKSSDPLSRVEWKHLAKTGNLATKNFREERSGKIVVLVDAREVSDRKAEKGHPTGVDLSAYAAKRVFQSLMKSRHRPGLAVLGVEPGELRNTTDSPVIPYIKPGRSRKTQQKIQETLTDLQKAEKKNESDLKSRLYRVLPPNSQVVIFTPLLDDELISAIKVLDNHGFPSTVVSPDVAYSDTPGARLESVRRDLRLKELRKWAPVVDWDVTEPMSIQVSKALRRIYKRNI